MTESSSSPIPASDVQGDAWAAGVLPPCEDLGDGWWCVPTPIPAGPLTGTLGYAHLGDDGVHLIDPGWDSQAALDALTAGLTALGAGIRDIVDVIVTHHHPDHLGLAGRLRDLVGARVIMSEREARVLDSIVEQAPDEAERARQQLDRWGAPHARRQEMLEAFARPAVAQHVTPDRVVADSESIALGGCSLEAVVTPGHTGGHMCLADRDARMLFTGDHVLPRTYSGLGIGVLEDDEPLSDMFASLDRLAEFDDFLIVPGHEYRFTGLADRREGIAAHHLRRTAQVAALVGELGDAPVWHYAQRLSWSAGWDGLEGFWLYSALRQTEMHLSAMRRGTVDDRLSPAR